MARNTTTTSLESKAKVTNFLDAVDLFFLIAYFGISLMLVSEVHEYLKIPFLIFSPLMGAYLVMRSPFNKRRKNYESIYFLLARDTAIYRPFISKKEEI